MDAVSRATPSSSPPKPGSGCGGCKCWSTLFLFLHPGLVKLNACPWVTFSSGILISLEQLEHSEILLDRLVIQPDVEDRLTDSLELCYREGNGIAQIHIFDGESDSEAARSLRFTERFECQYCNIAYRSLDPRLCSFNNPYG